MTITLQRRMLYIPVLHIDTNLINVRQKLHAVNQLEKWYGGGVILINMAGTARGEALAGGNAQRTRKANQQIFTLTPPAPTDGARFKGIEALLFPGGAEDENQRNDVRIVADAIHYAAILVTNDGGSKSQPGGILGNRDALAQRFGIQILSAEEAVDFVRVKIQERDEFNRQVVRQFGGQLPDWTRAD
jgi:hypothetical protein